MVCGGRLKRNGRTSAGRTRWRCTTCGSSSTRTRTDVTRRAELEAFVAWLTSTGSQRDLDGGTGRTFRDRHAWCWRVEPSVEVTGEIYTEVQLDGIYLAGGWCCLIAIAGGHVIGWQWCDREKRIAWQTLLERIPAPKVVVTDGGRGILAAIAESWPTTRVQRCLVHVQRNIRTYLTSKPRTDAGKALWALAKSLTKISSRHAATTWLTTLNDWHRVYGHLTRKRTYRDQVNPDQIPSWARPEQRWWYTHARLRRAYRLLARLTRDDALFTYLDEPFDDLRISSTTNHIEGGINAGIRTILRAHRGMPSPHQRRAVEWWLYQHSEHPRPAAKLIRPEHHTPEPTPASNEPVGPIEYDTALTAEEGLWARKGWAGRT